MMKNFQKLRCEARLLHLKINFLIYLNLKKRFNFKIN